MRPFGQQLRAIRGNGKAVPSEISIPLRGMEKFLPPVWKSPVQIPLILVY